jgi:hypothetical protein
MDMIVLKVMGFAQVFVSASRGSRHSCRRWAPVSSQARLSQLPRLLHAVASVMAIMSALLEAGATAPFKSCTECRSVPMLPPTHIAPRLRLCAVESCFQRRLQ